MKTIGDLPEAAEDHAGFILTDRTIAALSQLDPTERDTTLKAIQTLKSHGLHKESGLSVERLSEPIGAYAIRLHTPSDLRLIVREDADGSIVVLSVFRAETLRGFFHAS